MERGLIGIHPLFVVTVVAIQTQQINILITGISLHIDLTGSLQVR